MWQPEVRPGFLGALMGREGDFVVQAGYMRAFSRNGMNDFTGFYNSNPGVTINANRSDALGNLVAGGSAPVLLRDQSRLGPPAFSRTPLYPLTDVVTEDASMIDPSIRVPSADSWSAGIQRSLGRDTSIEVRYVGTRSRDGWANINYNEVNIIENGFVNEFRAVQANLTANIAGAGARPSRTPARPARCRCRPSSHSSTACQPPMRETPLSIRARTGRTPRSSRSWLACTRIRSAWSRMARVREC